MKLDETIEPEIETSLFQESFKTGWRKLLFLLNEYSWMKSLKHPCFIKCFNDIAPDVSVKADFVVLKHILHENLQNGYIHKGRLKYLGTSPTCILHEQFKVNA